MKTRTLLFLFIQLSVFSINAQSLSESLGAVKTNFQIFSDNKDLNVTDQFIIKRAEKKSYTRAVYDGGYGYGYGYQSLHLEFVTQETYILEEFDHKFVGNNSDKLELTFYDSNDVALATDVSDFSVVDLMYSLPSEKLRFFYSIDLIDIPVILLDKTVKIDLIKLVSDKKD